MATPTELRRLIDGNGTAWLCLDGVITAVTAKELMALSAVELTRSAVRFTIEAAEEATRQQRREAARAAEPGRSG